MRTSSIVPLTLLASAAFGAATPAAASDLADARLNVIDRALRTRLTAHVAYDADAPLAVVAANRAAFGGAAWPRLDFNAARLVGPGLAGLLIAAFGGMFLLLVFLNFLLDDEKEVHWLGNIERKLGSLGKVSSISVLVSAVSIVGGGWVPTAATDRRTPASRRSSPTDCCP